MILYVIVYVVFRRLGKGENVNNLIGISVFVLKLIIYFWVFLKINLFLGCFYIFFWDLFLCKEIFSDKVEYLKFVYIYFC